MANKKDSIPEMIRIRRHPERGQYDRDSIYKILDAAFLCTIGFTREEQPFLIPTAYVRSENKIIIHGARKSRMHRQLLEQKKICVSVTVLDGLVLSRSAFGHSMNYRSVVAFGSATEIEDKREKLDLLKLFTNAIIPERWDDVRAPTDQELLATYVLAIDLEEASAKVRSGPPQDPETEYSLPYWAGEIPLTMKM